MFKDEEDKLQPVDIVKVGFFPPHKKLTGLYITTGVIVERFKTKGDRLGKDRFKVLVEGKLFKTPHIKLIEKIEDEEL